MNLRHHECMISDNVQSQKRRGRPATGTNPSVGVRMPESELARLDQWRTMQSDLPSRPEAIRRLVELGLETAQRQSQAR